MVLFCFSAREVHVCVYIYRERESLRTAKTSESCLCSREVGRKKEGIGKENKKENV